MSDKVARFLTRLYPRVWRQRYGEEFEEVLRVNPRGWGACADVIWSAVCEHTFPTRGSTTRTMSGADEVQCWGLRAPWALFSLAPLALLAGAYFVACSILWSGWRMFLPRTCTPFVPIDGFAVFYFGIGRLLYYGAPILIGWLIGFVAACQKTALIWPFAGLVLLALIGGTAEVHASRSTFPAAVGQVSMSFELGPSQGGIPDSVLHAGVILALTLLPFVFLRWRNVRPPAA